MANLIFNKITTPAGLLVLSGYMSVTLKVALLTSSYTPDETHDFANDLTNELSGGSYARVTLAGKLATEDTGNDRTNYIADNTTFAALNMGVAGTPKYAALLKDNGGADSANEVIGVWDLGTVGTNTGDFAVKWENGASSGVLFRVARAAGS